MSGEWSFTRSEVILTDKVLGRGAFGEVRVGKWRNINVACKTLHSVDQEHSSTSVNHAAHNSQELKQEIEMLSKLRHPNLVLFIGVCGNIIDGNTMIITELLPCSLYDILEHKKIEMSLADILDISSDIGNGLNYLHQHSPAIVHRDISSKNILIGGGKAKIADLGQAKLFGQSTLSRQTGMPGAMAYSAPEVLTGKYSAKIDIFSFGVLVCQMCSGEYPRIDRREEQIEIAVSRFAPLKVLVTAMMNFSPYERPDSGIVCDTLQSLRDNDRYYPVQQRIDTFERDMSVMARHWAEEQVNKKCKEISTALEQTSRRLAAEEARWKKEADKVDGLNNQVEEALNHSRQSKEAMDRAINEHSLLLEQLNKSKLDNETLTSQVGYFGSEQKRLQAALQAKEQQLLNATLALDQARSNLSSSLRDGSSTSDQLEQSRENELELTRRNQQLQMQLNGQLDYTRDMENRLEQALVRWKQEQQQRASESTRCTRLAQQNGQQVDEIARLNGEIVKYEKRLRQYADLPLPDEIKMRMKDLQGDIKQCHDDMASLTQEKQIVQEELLSTQEKLNEFESFNNQLKEDIDKAKTAKLEAEENLLDRSSLVAGLEKDLQEKEQMLMNLTVDNKRLQENDQTLSKVISDLQASLASEKQKVGQLRRSGLTTTTTTPSSPLSRPRTGQQQQQQQGNNNNNNNSVDIAENGEENDGEDRFSMSPLAAGGAVLNEVSTAAVAAYNNSNSNSQHPVVDVIGWAGSPIGGDSNATTAAVAGMNSASVTAPEALKARILDFEQRALLRERQNKEANEDRKPELTVKLEIQSISAGSDGATMLLVDFLREGTHDERIVWRTCRALRDSILKDSAEDETGEAAAAVRAGLCAAKFELLLIQCMNRYMDLAVVQCHCIRLLGTLAFGSDLFRRKAGEKEAMSAIVTAMHMHPEDSSVQLHGCTAITNFTHNSLENRSRFIEAGGVETLLQSMSLHMDSPKLQRQACWAMLTISGSDEAAVAVVNLRGEALVIAALSRHPYDSGVQQFGFWALRNLAMCTEDIAKLIKKQGVVELCKMACENHSQDAEVLKQARHMLGVLSPLVTPGPASSSAPQYQDSPYGPGGGAGGAGGAMGGMQHSASTSNIGRESAARASSALAMHRKLRSATTNASASNNNSMY